MWSDLSIYLSVCEVGFSLSFWDSELVNFMALLRAGCCLKIKQHENTPKFYACSDLRIKTKNASSS